MEKLLYTLSCIYLLSYSVSPLPVYNTGDLQLDEIYEHCNTEAVNKLTTDASEPIINSLLNNENWAHHYPVLELLARSKPNTYTEGLIDTLQDDKNGNGIEENLEIRMMLENLSASCLEEYLTGARSTQNMKRDEKFSLIDPHNFSDKGLKEILGAQNIRDSKKRKVIGLNPTGWRKRRSQQTENNEDYSSFLRNMRELLEKRERLQFNPTGW